MNILWSSMLLLGIAYGALQGRMPEVTDGVIQASREAVVLAVSLVGVTGFWAGLMEIAKKAGVIDGLVKRMGPVMRFLFPEVPEDHPAMRAAGMNMICNVFGLGAAATPPGLAAMERFEELEEERRKMRNPAAVPEGTANREMCTFLILNISSLRSSPSTSLRTAVSTAASTQQQLSTGACCDGCEYDCGGGVLQSDGKNGAMIIQITQPRCRLQRHRSRFRLREYPRYAGHPIQP